MAVNWDAVAERLRSIIRVSSEAEISETAERIGVRDDILRESLSGRSRLSAVKVIAALARHSGVDPTWILSGHFDPSTHRMSLEGTVEETERVVKNLIGQMGRNGNETPSPGV